jgi:hypothetical protein
VAKRGRSAVIGLIALAVLSAITLYFVSRAGKRPFGLSDPIGCIVQSADKKVSLDLTQMANAATVTAVGLSRRVPERAVVVALSTALQESKLENLDGGDRDSLGLFQQRPSQGWGTPEQIRDPRYASRRFYAALLKVKGWQTMRITDAAQRVQRSAYPNAYEKWADEAQVMADALMGKVSAAVVCTVPESAATLSGQEAVTALAETMRLDYGAKFVMQEDPARGAVRVPAADGAEGWAYAHWLVSRAADRGVSRVTFAGRQWSAETGGWAVAPTADASQVVAEVSAI